MNFEVVMSPEAQSDIRGIGQYIATELLAPDSAIRIVRELFDEIATLAQLPERYPLYHEEPWRSRGIRYFSVRSYNIFYLMDALQERVNIVRILYCRRNPANMGL